MEQRGGIIWRDHRDKISHQVRSGLEHKDGICKQVGPRLQLRDGLHQQVHPRPENIGQKFSPGLELRDGNANASPGRVMRQGHWGAMERRHLKALKQVNPRKDGASVRVLKASAEQL